MAGGGLHDIQRLNSPAVTLLSLRNCHENTKLP